MSRTILEKVGIKKKKDDVRLLFRTKDIADYSLDGICQRPTQYFYASPEDSRFLPKILSAAVLTRSHQHKREDPQEKCSYLFRSVESNLYEDATFAPETVERVHVYDLCNFLSISFIILLLGFLSYFIVELYDSFMDFLRRTLASKD